MGRRSGGISHSMKEALKSHARKSSSTYRVSAVALNKKGEILGYSCNGFRKERIRPRRYSGQHAEARLIRRYGGLIKTILIMRCGNAGAILPIDACCKCRKLADKYGIRIVSIDK